MKLYLWHPRGQNGTLQSCGHQYLPGLTPVADVYSSLIYSASTFQYEAVQLLFVSRGCSVLCLVSVSGICQADDWQGRDFTIADRRVSVFYSCT